MQVFGQKLFSCGQFLGILLLGHVSVVSWSSVGHGGNRGAEQRLKVVILRTISVEKVHFLCTILQFYLHNQNIYCTFAADLFQ